jgi:lysophospholipase L1-like esterase
LTYDLIDPTDGLPAGEGPITTAKGATVALTPATGDFTYQPASGGARGIDTFDFQVSDPDGMVASATETVIVDQNIMPLGDSITLGTNGDTPDVFVGYRKPLYEKLKASGFNFDFVGTLADAIGSPPVFDPDHEGHGGWTALEIALGGGSGSDPNDTTDGIFGWLTDNPADVVLLHIGTNDINTFLMGNADDVEAILDEIDRWENVPNNPVTVILARIIDQTPFPEPEVSFFNDAVETMVNQRIANGDDIIMVDQYSALTYPPDSPNDMSEGLHPNTSGYDKMADVWLAALSQPNPNFDPDPATGQPVYVIDKCR